jgi:hypothetical protein
MSTDDLKQIYLVVFNQYTNIVTVTSNFEKRLHYFIGLFSLYLSTVTIISIQIFLNTDRFVSYYKTSWLTYVSIIGFISFIIIDLIIFTYFYKSKRRYTTNLGDVIEICESQNLDNALTLHIDEMKFCIEQNFKKYDIRSNLFNLSKKLFFILINFIVLGLIILIIFT